MKRIDPVFANHYFRALDVFFHPDQSPYPRYASWQTALAGTTESRPVIVQQLLAALTAHIEFDLSLAIQEAIAPRELAGFHIDYLRINQVLDREVRGLISELDALSPALKDVFDVLGKLEKAIIDEGSKLTRGDAWAFGKSLIETTPTDRQALIAERDTDVAAVVRFVLEPSLPFALVPDLIAVREVRDVGKIRDVLDGENPSR